MQRDFIIHKAKKRKHSSATLSFFNEVYCKILNRTGAPAKMFKLLFVRYLYQKCEMKVHKTPNLSIEEYLRQEIETDTKYEYHDGKIYSLVDEKDPVWEVVFFIVDQQAKIINFNINDGECIKIVLIM